MKAKIQLRSSCLGNKEGGHGTLTCLSVKSPFLNEARQLSQKDVRFGFTGRLPSVRERPIWRDGSIPEVHVML